MTFARQDSWKGHTHSKVRSFLCSICGKTFARRNIRDTHERAHLNDRRYPCSYCGKKFMTNQQRTNHERTHTGEKPFQVCSLPLQGVKKRMDPSIVHFSCVSLSLTLSFELEVKVPIIINCCTALFNFKLSCESCLV